MLTDLDRWLDKLSYLDPRIGKYSKKACGIGLKQPNDLPTDTKEKWYKSLGSLKYKAIAISGEPANSCIGGLCIFYTGDLNQITSGYLPNGKKIENKKQFYKWLDNLPRLDQIIGTIGPTNAISNINHKQKNTQRCIKQ